MRRSLLFFLLTLTQAVLPAMERSLSGRAGFGAMHDSNVFESFVNAESDQLVRAWIETSGRFRPSRRFGMAVEYSGGLDAYATRSEETRSVHDLAGTVEVGLLPALSCGMELGGRVKSFFRAGRGHSSWHGRPFVRWKPADGLTVSASGWWTGFDFNPGSAFDYRSAGAEASIEATPVRRLTLGACASAHELRFHRKAIAVESPVYSNSLWKPLDAIQKDRVVELGVSVEGYWWAYGRLRVSYESDASNAYGYSYRDPRFEAALAKPLPWGMAVQLVWTSRRKTYEDELSPFLRIRPDAEDETSRQVLLDVSKRLGRAWTARVRVARYRNESPFRDLYYQKDVASVGCAWEF
jgi:hypothetical protein